LQRCSAGRWLLLGGTIRFATAEGNSFSSSLSTVDIRFTQTDRAGTPALCNVSAMKTVRSTLHSSVRYESVPIGTAETAGSVDDGDRYLSWRCLVAPGADGSWSGSIELLSGRTVIGFSSGSRICRLSPEGGSNAPNGANIAAAAVYRQVMTALLEENFLIVAARASCGTTSAVAAR
ncbi:MAG: hypothetical protein M3Z16_05690, partial [Pseudomonadota bacterium]|nr:hypothetical protein [Pseudomonadota bacterium]